MSAVRAGPRRHVTDQRTAAVLGARAIGPAVGDDRMAAPGLADHITIQCFRVVGADEPERGLGWHGHFEQCLVELTFDDLRVPPTGPDGLTDAPDRSSAVPGSELPPGWNDPRRVVTELGNVSANSTRSASGPSAARSTRSRDSMTATSTGSSRTRPSRMNGTTASTNPCSPRYITHPRRSCHARREDSHPGDGARAGVHAR